MPDVLSTLKTETKEEHIQLEEGLDLFGRVTSLTSYRDLLERFFTIYEPLEKILVDTKSIAAAGWNVAPDLKTGWLRADLESLGHSEPTLAALPRCEKLPEITYLSPAVGCLYVLEGSTLGGQIISSRFNKTLGVSPSSKGRFFSGYADQTIPHWRHFGSWVRSIETQLDLQKAVIAAKETFQSFHGWLNVAKRS